MDEYAAYSDIIQPIQVAVYEMKFGLSLVLSSTWEKKCLNELGQEDINVIMVCYFMSVVMLDFILYLFRN